MNRPSAPATVTIRSSVFTAIVLVAGAGLGALLYLVVFPPQFGLTCICTDPGSLFKRSAGRDL